MYFNMVRVKSRSFPDTGLAAYHLWTKVSISSILYGVDSTDISKNTWNQLASIHHKIGKFILQVEKIYMEKFFTNYKQKKVIFYLEKKSCGKDGFRPVSPIEPLNAITKFNFDLGPCNLQIIVRKLLLYVQEVFYIVTYLIKKGHYFLDIQ